jgi:hypothetical protein
VQACLRAGGKHNDLENVGYTARHHTFFEMLGNWSFGDYFKKESIEWGWELLTKVFGLPAEKLLATVYHEDDEAYDIWKNVIGLPAERIIRIGDNKGGKYKSDNFWMMADTGPCGPCSEIFYDHGEHIAGGPPGSPEEDGDRFIEIWNHVFMQFDMKEDGSVVKLPAPCVDTGMGLERLAAILQHVHSNYEIDLFQALIKAAGRETHTEDLSTPSLKVIADHIRATSFLVSDGVILPTKVVAMCSAASSAAPSVTATSWARRLPSSTSWWPTWWCRWAMPIPSSRSRKRISPACSRPRKSVSSRPWPTAWKSWTARWPATSRCCPAMWPSSCTTPTASRWTCPTTWRASVA